ncbi:hypothetical protein EBT16_00215 [bacterium]|nr:hypothetical protein [bacterium]
MLNAEIGVGCGGSGDGCGGSGGCPETPDFCIKRHDTRPSFRVAVSDCDGVLDLTDENLVLEASMWFETKIKAAVNQSATVISFADNIGFDQVLVGDLIVTNRVRNPEKMLVSSIDEVAKTITVQRGRNGTTSQSLARGASLNIFRFVDSPAEIESVFGEVTQVDGTVTNELLDTFLVFNWTDQQTSLPGCYRMEFKLLRISPTTAEVEWTKRFPLGLPGFVINVVDSATSN